jgi:hypothetical protein
VIDVIGTMTAGERELRVRLEVEEDARDPRREFDHWSEAEIRAWRDGEVYGWIVEEQVIWHRADGDSGEMETWEHLDSCWGFYGRAWAEQNALEALRDASAPATA